MNYVLFPCFAPQMNDASFAKFLVKPKLGDEVDFEAEKGEKGQVAVKVQRVTSTQQ